MAPSIALNTLRRTQRQLTVLDPMAGSGTTLLAARKQGHVGIGFDTDPLAALLTRVSTMDLEPEGLIERARDVHGRATTLYPRISAGEAYPNEADEETKAFIRYWFDPLSRRQLKALTESIGERKGRLAAALWCAFSRLIIAKDRGVSRARDLSHSRPHRTYDRGPIKPLDEFFDAAAFVAENGAFAGGSTRAPEANVRVGDARRLPLSSDSVDLVITSPPYLNAIDYVRCSKFTLVWMGYTVGELRRLRSRNIGSEVSLPEAELANELEDICDELDEDDALPARERAVLARYLRDMDSVASEIGRVLKPSAKAVIVIGNSNVCGHFIENSRAMTRIFARHGMRQKRCVVRELPPNRRYLPPPKSRRARGMMHGRMREEVVLTFGKMD
jgi:DNA modification methylase